MVNLRFREIPVNVPLQRVAGRLSEVLESLAKLPQADGKTDTAPLLEVSVLLDGPEPSLRHYVEEALDGKHVRLARIDARNKHQPGTTTGEPPLNPEHLKEIRPVDLLQDLYRNRYNQPLPEHLQELFRSVEQEAAETLLHRLSAMKAGKEAAELDKNRAEADWSEKKNLREKAKPALDAAKKLDAQLEEKIKQIQSAEREMNDARRKLAAQVKELSGERAGLDALNREIVQLTVWVDERRNKQQVAENERYIIGKLEDAHSHRAKYEAHRSRLETAQAALESIKTNLAGYFITGSWFDHWQHAPEQFIRDIAEFAAAWRWCDKSNYFRSAP